MGMKVDIRFMTSFSIALRFTNIDIGSRTRKSPPKVIVACADGLHNDGDIHYSCVQTMMDAFESSRVEMTHLAHHSS